MWCPGRSIQISMAKPWIILLKMLKWANTLNWKAKFRSMVPAHSRAPHSKLKAEHSVFLRFLLDETICWTDITNGIKYLLRAKLIDVYARRKYEHPSVVWKKEEKNETEPKWLYRLILHSNLHAVEFQFENSLLLWRSSTTRMNLCRECACSTFRHYLVFVIKEERKNSKRPTRLLLSRARATI